MWRCKAQNLWSKGLWYNERHLLWLYQRKTDFAHDFHWLQDFPGLEWEISSWVGCGFLVSDSPPTSLPPTLHNDQACCCLSWGGGGITECRDEFKFSIVSWVYGTAVIFFQIRWNLRKQQILFCFWWITRSLLMIIWLSMKPHLRGLTGFFLL